MGQIGANRVTQLVAWHAQDSSYWPRALKIDFLFLKNGLGYQREDFADELAKYQTLTPNTPDARGRESMKEKRA